MSAKVMEALAELRLGVEMDAAHDPSGKTKLDALDEAMRAIEAADQARGGEVVAQEPARILAGIDPFRKAVDQELVCAHLGVTSENDDYESAKKKLAELIDWHVAVAIDPAVNGGFKLAPVTAPPAQAVDLEQFREAAEAMKREEIKEQTGGLTKGDPEKIARADRLLALLAAQQPAAPVLAKHQPCGCVICTCEDEQQCQGCGAKHCGNRADHPPYVGQQPARRG
ncbi:hypothetical protein [[Pseudomonas] boreopolis]|uniref:Uncharacterized protein n=1 Tax=Xanthomonas boreopolis TaxID=86183 RepID=A0A919F882_9XANT|nr:hypothetical protein GCM10009090_17680 [[Pseudomonas] boreopolis]